MFFTYSRNFLGTPKKFYSSKAILLVMIESDISLLLYFFTAYLYTIRLLFKHLGLKGGLELEIVKTAEKAGYIIGKGGTIIKRIADKVKRAEARNTEDRKL